MADKPKRKWIAKAINPERKGAFKAKAKAAGESTREFASEHAGDSGKTGKQARLATTLMNMHHGKDERRKRMYNHPRSKSE